MARKSSNLLQFRSPSSWWGEKWREGLYSGNGKIGANLFGGAADEKILINDATLTWSGRTNVVPDVATKMREVRKLIENGDFLDAQDVLPKALKSKNFHPQSELPLPLCTLDIRFLSEGNVTNFSRTLNMENGEVCVNYSLSGTRINRSLFVSRDNNLIAYQITKQGNIPLNVNFGVNLVENFINYSDDTGNTMPEGVSISIDRQFLCFAARNSDDGTDFGIVARILTSGGMTKSEDNQLKVSMANGIFVLVETFTKSSREKEWQRLKTKLNAVKDSYDKMLRTHQALHSKLFNLATVELSDGDDRFVEDLLIEANTVGMSPLLCEKLYKFGRYLFISASAQSQEGSYTDGLWNGSYKPLRASNNNSGDLQMTYLHCLAGNLAQNVENLFSQYQHALGDFQTNAMRLFGCRGIVVPAVCAPNTGRLGSNDVFAVHFTAGAGWLCSFFYKYAKFTQNNKFLKTKLLPFMKEVATFYEDFFVEKEGVLASSPSALPMRLGDSATVSDRPVVAKNSALDFAVARQFFENLIEACAVVSANKDDIERFRKFAGKLPEQQSSGDGQLREFVNSITTDYTGISVGTLYPAYFGSEVDFLSSTEMLDLYEKSADRKLQNCLMQNSFYMAILASVYARLKNSFKAKQCISNVVKGCLMGNLVAVDKDWRGMGICGSADLPPVQLQTNLVIVNAVQEMLLYSKNDTIFILPSAPSDWKIIQYNNLLCENGVVASCWLNLDKGQFSVELLSKREQTIQLYLPAYVKKLTKCSNRELTKLTTSTAVETSIRNLKLDANKPLTLQFKV